MSDARLLSPAALVRRVLFFNLIVAMTLLQLFISFKGLSTPQGMDQAQVARQIARNEGFTTQVIRPVVIGQAQASGKSDLQLKAMPDTYNAPLGPIVNAIVLKAIDGDNPETWRMGKNDSIYELDRVIAAVSVTFFLIALCVTYFLIARIFDTKIAGVAAILILLCDLIWQFTLTGLPQMLALMLISIGLSLTYRAVEAKTEGRNALLPLLGASLSFALMVLSVWVSFWILLGFVAFAIVYFRPRGIAAILAFSMLAIGATFSLAKNYAATGSPFGTAFLSCYNTNPIQQEIALRSLDFAAVQFNFQNLILTLAKGALTQITEIFIYLGGIVAAPIFFLSLLHPFKRESIADFRWCVLSMWFFGTVGMTIFGVSDRISPNQVHILFAPIMTGYGLAMVSILWARLGIAQKINGLSNLHHIIIVIISAGPLLLSSTIQVKDRLGQNQLMWVNYPYVPQMLNAYVNAIIPKSQSILTDQPEAVAWYADRTAIMMPTSISEFEEIETKAKSQNHSVAAILVTPSSHGTKNLSDIISFYRDFSPLIVNGSVLLDILGSRDGNSSILAISKSDKLARIRRDYVETTPSTFSGQIPILAGQIILYRNNDEGLMREAAEERSKNKKEEPAL